MLKRTSQLFATLLPYQRSLISGLVGLVFYGAWAFGVNFHHGIIIAVKAACVQGSYSFTLTLFNTILIEQFYTIFSKLLNNSTLIRFATILVTISLVFSTSWTVHVIAQTPEIFKTVILGYVVGGIYTSVYVYSLAKLTKQRQS